MQSEINNPSHRMISSIRIESSYPDETDKIDASALEGHKKGGGWSWLAQACISVWQVH